MRSGGRGTIAISVLESFKNNPNQMPGITKFSSISGLRYSLCLELKRILLSYIISLFDIMKSGADVGIMIFKINFYCPKKEKSRSSAGKQDIYACTIVTGTNLMVCISIKVMTRF